MKQIEKQTNPTTRMADQDKVRNPKEAPPTLEEIVALALNEQGYLFQHKIEDLLAGQPMKDTAAHNWHVEATELPVSIPNYKETRVDLLLCHGKKERTNWRALLECKRSSPDFKRWIFFGQMHRHRGALASKYYVEVADAYGQWDNQSAPPMIHRVDSRPASQERCPVYDYGVEARVNRTNSNSKASATTAIEDACQQITLGQAGLAHRLRTAREPFFRLLPVVVTTAELYSAQFVIDRVSLDRGMINPADLDLERKQWLALNYRVNDFICQHSGISGVTTNRTSDLPADMAARQVRTIFIAQAEHLQEFLAWLEEHFECSG